MMNIHRYYYPDQIVFITQIVKGRRKIFNDFESVTILKNVFHNVKEIHPFSMLGYVFMPDHFHLFFRPKGDSNFSQIMHSLKWNFTKSYKEMMGSSGSLNLWQARFWDHVLRDEKDLEDHLHYIHFNPVIHGYVKDPKDWQHSSYHSWETRGLYEGDKVWAEPENRSWGE